MKMHTDMQQYLEPTPTIDYDHPLVEEFARKHAVNPHEGREQAVRLYFAVRDGIRYDPYLLNLSVQGLKASTTLMVGRGWCVAKAILLAACCRYHGIPARLGYADVRNHLSTARMREQMKTDVFYWHGYTSIFLDGKWLKATPAFNIELCEKFRLKPLDFDGYSDSIYQPFDLDGNRHMDYLKYRGEFADVPIDLIIDTFRREYGADDAAIESLKGADFDREADRENS